MSAPYSWCISVDKLYDGEYIERNECGTVGPHNAPLTYNQIMKHPNKKRFRILDDDRQVYYYGYIVGLEHEDVSGFEPLDDFGTPNAGATTIQYKNDDGKWVDL